MEMKRSIAFLTQTLNLNGIGNVIMSYCNILYKKYNITIFTEYVDKENEIKCNEMNIDIIKCPRKRNGNPVNYYVFLLKKLKSFDIVHIHCSSATVLPDLIIAKINRNKNVIVQSHSCGSDFKFIHNIFKPFVKIFSKNRLACSDSSGKWLFGKKNFEIIYNGIDVEKFKYNDKLRKKIRKSLNIENNFVIGHVGTHSNAKNHKFILELFRIIYKKNKNVKLVLVGVSEKEILSEITDSSIIKNIICCGKVDNVFDYYNAFDCFIFPSLYEGFGIAAVEAQINGLNCFASRNVPRDIIVSDDNIDFIDLDNINDWKNKIDQVINNKLRSNRLNFYDENLENIKKFSKEKSQSLIENYYNKFKLCRRKEELNEK